MAPEHGVGAHAVLGNGTEVFLPLEGVIDVEREVARLQEEVAKLEKHVADVDRRLANQAFVERAPAEVVARERDKARTAREQLAKLGEKLDHQAGR